TGRIAIHAEVGRTDACKVLTTSCGAGRPSPATSFRFGAEVAGRADGQGHFRQLSGSASEKSRIPGARQPPFRSYSLMDVHDDPDRDAVEQLRARSADPKALGEVWDRYRERLRRVVRLRLDRRLQGRVDPSDVLQDAFLDFQTRARDYVQQPDM